MSSARLFRDCPRDFWSWERAGGGVGVGREEKGDERGMEGGREEQKGAGKGGRGTRGAGP